MIQSIYIIAGDSGDVLLEKHYKGIIGRDALDSFWTEVEKHKKRDDVPPVLMTTKFYLCNIYREGIYFLALLNGEMAVLSTIEFLHRIFDVYKSYFGQVTARTITGHFATAFQLLDEMLDNGYPMISEPNALNTFIAPPSVMATLTKFTTGKSKAVGNTIQDATMSVIPWRRNGVSYTNNEISLEITEVIDCIVESNGTVVVNDLKGYIHATSKLSGTPDLILFFTNPNILDDVSFHPCVRYARFDREKIVSFVPPDGHFLLMTYSTVDKNVTAPIYCRPSVTHREGVSNVSFVLGTRPMASRNTNIMSVTSSGGISSHTQSSPNDFQVEHIVVTITFPKAYRTINVTPNVGKIFVDVNTNVVTWTVGKYPRDVTPELQGAAYLDNGVSNPIESIHATMRFNVPNTVASGLSIRDLQLTRETYKFFKGLKTNVRAGRYQIRT